MKLSDIRIRDPFILPFEDKYYLFGSIGDSWKNNDGFYYHVSNDLKNWSEVRKCFTPPDDFWAEKEFWAPEVHCYQGEFYTFATFAGGGRMRTCQILKSERPEGPYKVWSSPITPADWMCLDGTLYIENGKPYMIFCHEWLQARNGEMCAIELTQDLKESVGEPFVLFKANENELVVAHPEEDSFVTDGPFMYKTTDGKLLMLWSCFVKNGYAQAVACSSNGSVFGDWQQCNTLLSDENGGHGMLFNDFNNKLHYVMHRPNKPYELERAVLFSVDEITEEPFLRITEI